VKLSVPYPPVAVIGIRLLLWEQVAVAIIMRIDSVEKNSIMFV
jgi:hypothetical protein